VLVISGLLTWFYPVHPRLLWFLVFNVALVYGICLGSDPDLPLYRRVGIGYLLTVSLAHFWAGVFGTNVSSELVANLFFSHSLVLPLAALTHAIRTCVSIYPCRLSDLGYSLPESPRDLSPVVIVLAGIGVAAAIAMLKRVRIAYFVWLGLVVISVCASLWNIVAVVLPTYPRPYVVDLSSGEYIDPLCWSVSCGLAYWFACREDKAHNKNTTA
jgi:hypothetical protein